VLREGWLFTGDLATCDENGFFRVVDRKKDLIITSAFNVYPPDVEAVLRNYPGVHDVAVVGEPDAEWGENVVAFVVAQAGAALTAAALDAHCIEHIARFKRPKRYVFVSALPKNNYGKVLKTALRERLAED